MGLAFERFRGIVNHWLRTGEWRGEEFAARGIGPVTTRTMTIALYSLLGAFVVFCVVLALT
jgi:hypothetical protein